MLGNPPALHVLPPPDDTWYRPTRWLSKIRSMANGDGLETNVRQLYEKVAELYEPRDRVFLFGFSRGAFTVRALAGLMWRYGIPSEANRRDAAALFDEAWPMFEHEFPDESGERAGAARRFFEVRGQRQCPIHFLGLWDTVKSYGGLDPVMLPHLRHNPSVRTVRHALALDERRGWFEATTWGWLDRDRKDDAASSRLRLSEADCQRIRQQDTLEVWFSGSHADVGGGALRNGRIDDTAEIALRWMLGEAACQGLELNDAGRAVLSVRRATERPRPRESRSVFWRIVELKRRLAINNDGRWPVTFEPPRGASPRLPLRSVRDDMIWCHESVTDVSRFGPLPIGVELKVHCTNRIPTASPLPGTSPR
jgi:hypothetical protein